MLLCAGIGFLLHNCCMIPLDALHAIIGSDAFKLFYRIYIWRLKRFSIWMQLLKKPPLLSPRLILHENNIACVYTLSTTPLSGPASLYDLTCNPILAITYNKNNLLWNWLLLSNKPSSSLSFFPWSFGNYKGSRWEKEWNPECSHNNIYEDVLLLALHISF